MAEPLTFSKSRLEALTDGIFSVVMTLLVLDVKIPDNIGALTDAELASLIISFEPKLSAYLISFLVSALFWIGHHTLMHRVRSVDRRFLWLNLCFVFTLTFMPFTTDLIGEHPGLQLAMLVYGVNLIASLMFQWLLWVYLHDHPELQEGELTLAERRALTRRFQLTALITALAVGISFVSPKASVYAYSLLIFVIVLRLRPLRQHRS